MTFLRAAGSALLIVLAIAGCQRPPAPGPQAGVLTGAPVLNTVTAAQLVDTLGAAGLSVPNAHDVTAQQCPEIKCIEAQDTDAVTVVVFSTTGAAQEYAATRSGTYLIQNVVLVFKTVPVQARAAYEKVVNRQLH